MIESVTELPRLRALVAGWKREGLRVGLVPTMGNLHAGHFSLVERVRERADRVVASIFVNPTQFGPNEDFSRYPRTPDADIAGLDQAGCDVAWLPSVAAMYPLGIEKAMRMHAPGVGETLEGESRPGHFDGVCTVVSRLFNQVQPDAAAFGRKDYQQLAVIRQMVQDMAFPVEILAGDIVREADGLAMSSRNQYLSADARVRAVEMYRTLQAMREARIDGVEIAEIEGNASQRLRNAGFVVDYAVLRQPSLALPDAGGSGSLMALIAAKLDSTRLIDNLEF
ncbi:MAG: pantoate--beta-alanine ligase [Xanthomonadaceae bacterium]|nr:pantoate--beta-alanine ligase [Xanthomonadaceae bacterium]